MIVLKIVFWGFVLAVVAAIVLGPICGFNGRHDR